MIVAAEPRLISESRAAPEPGTANLSANGPYTAAGLLESPRLGGTCCVISSKRYHLVDGQYCTNGGFNSYIKVLSRIFDRLILAVPVSHGAPRYGVTPIEKGLASVAELPVYPYRYEYEMGLHPLGYGRPLRRVIAQADLIHIIMPGYVQLIGLLVAQLMSKPVFCSLMGDWEQVYAVGGMADRHPRFVRMVIDAHRVILRWILKSGPVFAYGRGLATKYRRINPGVVQNQSSTFSEADIRPAQSLGALHDPPRLLYVGRLDYKKGVTFLMEAQARLRDEGVTTRLTIVGDGLDRAEFEKCVDRLELRELVDFAGFIPQGAQLRQIYRDHDVFVLPSLTEGAPKVVVEAYANGLPVVATNAGGIPGMVSRENGILVAPSDAAALAWALRQILRDDAFRRRLAQNNLVRARSLTMEAMARHMAWHLKQAFPRLFADG